MQFSDGSLSRRSCCPCHQRRGCCPCVEEEVFIIVVKEEAYICGSDPSKVGEGAMVVENMVGRSAEVME